jgi:adenylate cyclase
LSTHDRNIGVIYIDHRLAAGIFDEDDLKFIAAFASNAAVAIERSQLQRHLHKEQTIRSNLERYLSPSIVDSIVTDSQAVELGTTRRMVTAVFVDIRNFTRISSEMQPDVVVEKLNNCFNQLVQIIFSFEGTLDKYLGDGLLAVWGAPISGDEDAMRAVEASIHMLHSMDELNKSWSKADKNHVPLNIGIGISTGPVLAGNIGTEKRMEYTIIGDDVNLAARLCEMAEPQQIILSENTWNQVKSEIKTRSLPPVNVKGKSSPVKVYSVET